MDGGEKLDGWMLDLVVLREKFRQEIVVGRLRRRGDDAAAEWYAERVSFGGQDLKTSSAIWGGLVDRVPERVDFMWPRAWAGTFGLLRRNISGVRLG
jgi:hypothetical protein